MLFARLVETSQRVAATPARLQKTARLAECLAGLDAGEIRPGVAYLAGRLPQGRIGIGYAAVHGVGAPPAAQPSLAVGDVDAALERMKGLRGSGSQAARMQALTDLLRRSTAAEQDFVRRLLTAELRQGAGEGVMAEAIAKAAGASAAAARRAVMLSGDLGEVAHAALTEGAAGLGRFRLQLFRPLQPMLAQPADGVADALAQLGEAALEWKIDGARVQVHRAGSDVRVFSRQLNDVTAAVPEVVEAVRALPVRSAVLDGEAIALRPGGAPHPFQVTMRRFGRRLDVERLRQELPVVPFFFDCLHLDGEDLIDRTAAERFTAYTPVVREAMRTPRVVTASQPEAAEFLDRALRAGHEGVMAKSLDAAYEAGRRGSAWLKVKVAHTLDLVVLAAEWGSGRRRGWLSNLHLGARDPATGGFVMLGKTFKGMTDEILAWQTARLQELEVARDAHTVRVRPELVVEIAFDGVQASPHYPGGVALRFARLQRYRPDKSAADADTIDTVRALHQGAGGE